MTQKSHVPPPPPPPLGPPSPLGPPLPAGPAGRPGRAFRIPGRLADVAPDQATVTEPGQQMAGDRGGRALALGAGDQQDAGGIGFPQPQAQATGHRDAPLFQPDDLGAVAADPRRLHDHVALLQRGEPAVAGAEHRHPADRDGLRAVIDQHRLDAHRAEPADIRHAFAAEAPHPGAGAAQI